MNGRVYDPGLGRFLSPDPYVQMPDFSQNFNRYSYVLNNPLKYTDPSGEFFGTFFSALKDYITIAFTKGGFEFWNDGIKEWGKSENWHSTTNAWKIDTGLYRADSNKGALGQIWEIFSRFTWQLPQTLAGNMYASGLNFFGGVKGVSHGYGMTAIETYSDRESAVTLSLYSVGPRGYKADYRDHLFVHEYGHYLQSQQMGPAFLLAVGLPSLQSTLVQRADGAISHHDRWFEADASYKGMKYFDKHYGGPINNRSGSNAHNDSFDRVNFVTGLNPTYINPRTNEPNRSRRPTTSYFHWTDITTYLPFLGSFFH